MGLETATYISQLVASNPTSSDPVSQGDDHLQLIKSVLQSQFTTLGAAAVTTTAAELNLLDGKTTLATEGTAVLSTGESVTTKFLRTDGDGTSSWQVPAGTTYTAGDGLDLSTTTFSTDLLSNGGLEIQSTELSVAQGISQYDVAQFAAGVVDDDFLRISTTSVEGRSASEVLSDIAALPLAGGTMSGTITCADEVITGPMLKDYSETKVAMAAHAVDLSLGNVQTYTLSGTQTLTFTNPIATGNSSSFTLIVTNGGSATLNWPTSVDWAAATAPTLTSSGIDVLTFTTIDGGTIWYGFAAGLAMG
jgi:hypothetical protein